MGGDTSSKKSLGGGSGATTDSGSSDGGESRKRKGAPEGPTAAEEAATASLMSLPGKLSNGINNKRDSMDVISSRDKFDPDHDLSTIEGQQVLNPNMSIEEARFQVSTICGI